MATEKYILTTNINITYSIKTFLFKNLLVKISCITVSTVYESAYQKSRWQFYVGCADMISCRK